jgi:hypothetical protein
MENAAIAAQQRMAASSFAMSLEHFQNDQAISALRPL